jgi:hypothetical protein
MNTVIEKTFRHYCRINSKMQRAQQGSNMHSLALKMQFPEERKHLQEFTAQQKRFSLVPVRMARGSVWTPYSVR